MQFSSSYRILINRKYNDILRINASQVSQDLFNSFPKDLYCLHIFLVFLVQWKIRKCKKNNLIWYPTSFAGHMKKIQASWAIFPVMVFSILKKYTSAGADCFKMACFEKLIFLECVSIKTSASLILFFSETCTLYGMALFLYKNGLFFSEEEAVWRIEKEAATDLPLSVRPPRSQIGRSKKKKQMRKDLTEVTSPFLSESIAWNYLFDKFYLRLQTYSLLRFVCKVLESVFAFPLLQKRRCSVKLHLLFYFADLPTFAPSIAVTISQKSLRDSRVWLPSAKSSI